ncbi:ATP phosphoribosyltransferase [Candidatus Vidania fulgoroideae]|uniref:ATP phosphoribosyltransferase n=1 Tax=Candidatus Vidania fulgoroideorum TaxID=881286 RepID=A0A974XAA7_9PROT|nr:ATP phosphoribosyltransferase [Candidatus Vidania fulgoroideae]
MINLGIRSGRIFEIFRKKFRYLSKDFEINSRKMIYYSNDRLIRFCKINDSDLDFYFSNMKLDFAVIGSDFYFEKNLKFNYIKLDVFSCRLSLISNGFQKCNTNRICTKYKKIVSSLKEFKNFDLVKVHGSIETCLILNLCDYIIDIVGSGETIRANGLKEESTLKYIYSLLVINTNVSTYKLDSIKKALNVNKT